MSPIFSVITAMIGKEGPVGLVGEDYSSMREKWMIRGGVGSRTRSRDMSMYAAHVRVFFAFLSFSSNSVPLSFFEYGSSVRARMMMMPFYRVQL